MILYPPPHLQSLPYCNTISLLRKYAPSPTLLVYDIHHIHYWRWQYCVKANLEGLIHRLLPCRHAPLRVNPGITPRSWPLQDIAIANTVWCIAYEGGGGGGVIYCALVVQ